MASELIIPSRRHAKASSVTPHLANVEPIKAAKQALPSAQIYLFGRSSLMLEREDILAMLPFAACLAHGNRLKRMAAGSS